MFIGGISLAQAGETPLKEEKKDAKKADKKGAAPKAPQEKKDANFRCIVRMANADIDGNRGLMMGIQKIGSRPKGRYHRGKEDRINPAEKIGNLSEAKTEEIEKTVLSYAEYVPSWAMNRQNDFETGEDQHNFGVDLEVSRKDDINRMKMIRCYKGVRHEQGQKVRGQRTKSNGRTGLTMGVSRQRVQQAGAAASTEAAPAAAAAAEKK